MRPHFRRHLGVLLALLSLAGAVAAQNPGPAESAAPAPNPARELLMGKCLQCHTDSIWRDQRQDARAWEATLYRMLGRGAVWSGDEIKTMASFLAIDYGPNSPRATRVAR